METQLSHEQFSVSTQRICFHQTFNSLTFCQIQ